MRIIDKAKIRNGSYYIAGSKANLKPLVLKTITWREVRGLVRENAKLQAILDNAPAQAEVYTCGRSSKFDYWDKNSEGQPSVTGNRWKALNYCSVLYLTRR